MSVADIEKKIEHPIARLAYAKLEKDKAGVYRLSNNAISDIAKALHALVSVAERERAANAIMTMAGMMITDKTSSDAASALIDLATRAFWSGAMPSGEEERTKTVTAATKAQLYTLSGTAPHIDGKAPDGTVKLRRLAVPPRRMRP